jgi:hypothetical protein
MHTHTVTTQSYLVEHFFNESWRELSSHPDRSTAETALAQWVEDDVARKYSTRARIAQKIISLKTDVQVIKELEF